jgi:hypothetical protein
MLVLLKLMWKSDILVYTQVVEACVCESQFIQIQLNS